MGATLGGCSTGTAEDGATAGGGAAASTPERPGPGATPGDTTNPGAATTNGSASEGGSGSPKAERGGQQEAASVRPERRLQAFDRADLEATLALKDASRDDEWTTEAFQDEVVPSLDRLILGLQEPERLQVAFLRHIVSTDATTTALRPATLEERKTAGQLRILEGSVSEERNAGRQAFADALTALASVFEGQPVPKISMKIVRIETLADGRVRTRLWVQSSGPGTRHFDAHWSCLWEQASTPWLVGLELERYSELERLAEPLFADATEAVLGANTSYATIVKPGLGHWLERLDQSLGNHLFGHHGLAVADVNDDGLDDLYVCLNGGLPNQLFLQQPDGTAIEAAKERGLDLLDYTRSALFVDLDGDGDQDAVLGTNELLVFEHTDDARFELRVRLPDDTGIYSLSAADPDLDGDLDLYVCRYVTGDKQVPDPYHDARNGPANAFLRNDGDWVFVDATTQVGLDANNDRFSFAATWSDYDRDGDLDLYVANDFGRNNLYQNDAGRFRDVAGQAGVEDISAGMSAAWGDIDNDGFEDLYVSNMFSSAGNRVSYQRNFLAGSDENAKALFQRHARGNSLFRNRGDGTFEDLSEESGVTLGRWAWGNQFADVDNDGYEDLFVANGFVSNDSEDDL